MELPDVSGYPLLLAELIRQPRWSANDIAKLTGGNLIRIMKEVEVYAATLASQSPNEDWISQELIEETSYCKYQDE